jgi:hypothetical protein
MQYSAKLISINMLLLVAWLSAFSSTTIAAETEASSLGNVITPQPIMPKNAEQCVEPTEFMRREHMNLLLDQRDKTVIDGIRTKKYSFTGCIDCHAQPAEGGRIVRAEDPDYFCTACHQYTAVKIDCFECHSDQPSAAAQQVSQSFNSLNLAGIYSGRTMPALSGSTQQPLTQQVEISGD